MKYGVNCWKRASFSKTPKTGHAGSAPNMKIETKAVHVGDRKSDPARPTAFIPVTTPIYAASSFLCESTAQLDRVLGQEEPGFCYARYGNPTTAALEELMTS